MNGRWSTRRVFQNGQAGLTLIELLVVFIIMATLAGLAIPQMGGFLERSWLGSPRFLKTPTHSPRATISRNSLP